MRLAQCSLWSPLTPVTGYELHIHQPECCYGIESEEQCRKLFGPSTDKTKYQYLPGNPCGYDIEVKPVLAVGKNKWNKFLVLTTDYCLYDLRFLDFYGCTALRHPGGEFQFSTRKTLDCTVDTQEEWINHIYRTPEFTNLRGVFHELCSHHGHLVEALLAEFNAENEFYLRPSQYAAFINRVEQIEREDMARMNAESCE